MEARKEEIKSPHDEVREKFQQVLDAMEEYMRNHPEKVESSDSERLKSIKVIAISVYQYYQKPLLIETFQEKLNTYLEKVKKNKATKKEEEKEDLRNFVLLPKLNPIFTPPVMPMALHTFHDIMVKAQQEAASMYKNTWITSNLSNSLSAAAAGHEPIAQRLASNVYLTVFSSQLASDDVLKSSVNFANCLRECLTDGAIYRSDRSKKQTVTFQKVGGHQATAKTYNFIFSANKAEAMDYITKNKYFQGCCFSAEFSFQLLKDKPTDPGLFIPLLSLVTQMDVWGLESGKPPVVCYLKHDAETKEFVIRSDHRPISIKQ